MPDITEGKIRLQFPPGWQVIKYDECAWHTQAKAGNAAHAVDVLAVDENNCHWWIEIKDCEGYEAENKPRLGDSDSEDVTATRNWLKAQGIQKSVSVVRSKPFIVNEILFKVRDTLAALALAHRQSEITLQPWNLYITPAPQWRVVLLLTWDINDFKAVAKRLQTKLTSAFRGYGIHISVVNQRSLAACGLPCTLTRLP